MLSQVQGSGGVEALEVLRFLGPQGHGGWILFCQSTAGSTALNPKTALKTEGSPRWLPPCLAASAEAGLSGGAF